MKCRGRLARRTLGKEGISGAATRLEALGSGIDPDQAIVADDGRGGREIAAPARVHLQLLALPQRHLPGAGAAVAQPKNAGIAGMGHNLSQRLIELRRLQPVEVVAVQGGAWCCHHVGAGHPAVSWWLSCRSSRWQQPRAGADANLLAKLSGVAQGSWMLMIAPCCESSPNGWLAP